MCVCVCLSGFLHEIQGFCKFHFSCYFSYVAVISDNIQLSKMAAIISDYIHIGKMAAIISDNIILVKWLLFSDNVRQSKAAHRA